MNENNNYLQLLYSKVKGILLYQGFPRRIIFCRKNWSMDPWLSKNFYFPTSNCTYSLLRLKCAKFFKKT